MIIAFTDHEDAAIQIAGLFQYKPTHHKAYCFLKQNVQFLSLLKEWLDMTA